MALSKYEEECLRAELLGLEKPDRSEFELQSPPTLNSEELACEGETIGRMNGGLDELNELLDSSKKKLLRFQAVNSRLGKIFHYRPKSQSKSGVPMTLSSDENLIATDIQPNTSSSGGGQSSLNFEECERQKDKLDSLLCKAERAELSMNHNNKLIKKCLKK